MSLCSDVQRFLQKSLYWCILFVYSYTDLQHDSMTLIDYDNTLMLQKVIIFYHRLAGKLSLPLCVDIFSHFHIFTSISNKPLCWKDQSVPFLYGSIFWDSILISVTDHCKIKEYVVRYKQFITLLLYFILSMRVIMHIV